MLSTRNLSLPGTRKLLPRWVGPFKVIKRVGQVAYVLELPSVYKHIHPVFHVSLLKAYIAPAPGQSKKVALPVLTEQGAVEYEVERILRHKKKGKSLQFLVLWRGFDLSEATWEPESHLANAKECIVDYWKSIG